MSAVKEEAIRLIQSMPDDCSLEEIQYHLYVIQKIERGLAAIDEGRVVPQEEAERRVCRMGQVHWSESALDDLSDIVDLGLRPSLVRAAWDPWRCWTRSAPRFRRSEPVRPRFLCGVGRRPDRHQSEVGSAPGPVRFVGGIVPHGAVLERLDVPSDGVSLGPLVQNFSIQLPQAGHFGDLVPHAGASSSRSSSPIVSRLYHRLPSVTRKSPWDAIGSIGAYASEKAVVIGRPSDRARPAASPFARA